MREKHDCEPTEWRGLAGQTQVTRAFQSLETFIHTFSIIEPAKPLGEGPATFIGPGRVEVLRSTRKFEERHDFGD